MKTFRDFLHEAAEADNAELIAGIETAFNKNFPNSRILAQTKKSVGRSYVAVEVFLMSTQAEQASNIWRNDPMHAAWNIFGNPEAYETERLMGGGIYLKPEEGSNLVMQQGKVPFRKTKGDTAKIVKAFDVHFKRLKDFVKENEANIYRRDKIADKYFK